MRAAQDRNATFALWRLAARVEQIVDLGEAVVDADDDCTPFVEQVFAQLAAAVHLDEQATELLQGSTAGPLERAPLAAKQARMRSAWRDAGRPTLERRHRNRV
jgi:hypothetical protein